MSDQARVLIAEGLLRIGEKLSGGDRNKYEYCYSLFLKLCQGEISVKDFVIVLDELSKQYGINDFFETFYN